MLISPHNDPRALSLGGDTRRIMQRQVTSIRLSEEEKAWLSERANHLRCSRGELIRALVRAYFNNHSRGGYLVKEVADIIGEIK
jgi:hypothetical protein